MSEEKKNTPAHDADKHARSHRHGYFIQPQATDKPQDIQIKNVATSGAEKQSNQHNQNHRTHKHKPQNRSQMQNAPTPNTENTTTQNQQQNFQRSHKKKHNKNRNKRVVDKQAAPTVSSVDSNAQHSKIQIPLRETKAAAANHSSDDYEEYKLFDEEDLSKALEKPADDIPEEETERTEVIGIRFKSSGKIYYFAPNGLTLKKGTCVIVDTARGQEYGEVAMSNSHVRSSDIVPPLREVIRAATEADTEHHKANKQKEQEAFKICGERILAHKLDMKLIDAQYTFDNTKLLFYFTSADRVDFRELVKDLASVFRTRIELRQIGIRDEAKLMGGLGMCGRPLCCTLFLSDFDQVSIKMAKEQNLSLNSAKISGICGRLMCCLKYEHEAYEYEIKRTPPVDSLVRTENGDGIVTEISPLRGTIKVRLLASPEVPPKVYHRDNVTMLRKKQNGENK